MKFSGTQFHPPVMRVIQMDENTKKVFETAIKLKSEDDSEMRSFWFKYVDQAMHKLGLTKDQVSYEDLVQSDK